MNIYYWNGFLIFNPLCLLKKKTNYCFFILSNEDGVTTEKQIKKTSVIGYISGLKRAYRSSSVEVPPDKNEDLF